MQSEEEKVDQRQLDFRKYENFNKNFILTDEWNYEKRKKLNIIINWIEVNAAKASISQVTVFEFLIKKC